MKLRPRRVWLSKRLGSSNRSRVLYTRTIAKILSEHLRNRLDPTYLRHKALEVSIHWKEFALRKSFKTPCFPGFSV